MKAVETDQLTKFKPKFEPTPSGEGIDNQIITSRWLEALNLNSNLFLDQNAMIVTVESPTTITGQDVVFEFSPEGEVYSEISDKGAHPFITYFSNYAGNALITLGTSDRFIPSTIDVSNVIRAISHAQISGIYSLDVKARQPGFRRLLERAYRN